MKDKLSTNRNKQLKYTFQSIIDSINDGKLAIIFIIEYCSLLVKTPSLKISKDTAFINFYWLLHIHFDLKDILSVYFNKNYNYYIICATMKQIPEKEPGNQKNENR